MSYTWFLFDADGTLFDYDKAEVAALSRTFVQFGYAFDAVYLDAYRTINGQLWRDFELGTIEQERIKMLRFERLFVASGISDRGVARQGASGPHHQRVAGGAARAAEAVIYRQSF